MSSGCVQRNTGGVAHLRTKETAHSPFNRGPSDWTSMSLVVAHPLCNFRDKSLLPLPAAANTNHIYTCHHILSLHLHDHPPSHANSAVTIKYSYF